ncbi:MAG: hypothetical protein HYW01_02380 [Deltaproteobacteria bacterium]|nr:hypothetical protein [Deltaproteobacteria bacterium]
MQNKKELKKRLEELDGRQGLIALGAVLEDRKIEEALEIAESSGLWANLEKHIGILSQEAI